jgi:hypothetical protein
VARVEYHSVWNHAEQTRLVSSVPAYRFQILYRIKQCKGHYEVRQHDGSLKVHLCREEHLQWRGEFADGTTTQFFDIEPQHFERWKRRAEKEKAAPKPQLMSEYSQKIARSADTAGTYRKALEDAVFWLKGQRIKG